MTSIDWTSHFDHFSPEYAADPFPIWDQLRQDCPVARSEKFRGMWVPTRHADIEAIARDTTTFSSRSPVVAEFGAMSDFGIEVPPISSDPPYHTGFRHLLLPFFSPARIDALVPKVTELADSLIDTFVDAGSFDAAQDYAQHIPINVIATMLGVPQEDAGRFRTWVHEMLEEAPTNYEVAERSFLEFFFYLQGQIEQRKAEPRDDLVTFLMNAELNGQPLTEKEIFGGCLLLLIAGIDTTWSAIGATIWHLAQHPDDQARLRAEPELWTTALEEFLRAFAPVTMAREVAVDTEFGGCPMRKGDPLLLPFPAANRDPEVFDHPDEVLLDRQHNRHAAFGIGIHRCLGSNLARMELRIAVQRLLERLPEFHLADPDAVTWSLGQVRGPRCLPLRF
jgi:cytochrome P450